MPISKKKSKQPKQPQFDTVLKRMLSTPPQPKIRQKAEDKPEKKNRPEPV